jgi:hypothetical protein
MLNYQRVLGTCHRKSSGTFPGKKKFPEVPRDIPVKKSQKKNANLQLEVPLTIRTSQKNIISGSVSWLNFKQKLL